MVSGHLVRVFNNACIKLATELDHPQRERERWSPNLVLFPLEETRLTDARAQWGNENQRKLYAELYNSYDADMQDFLMNIGSEMVRQSPSHSSEVFNHVMTGNVGNSSLIVPHMIGKMDDEYGLELRRTKGFQTLRILGSAMPQTQVSLWLTNDLKIKSLNEAMRFSILFHSMDGQPVRDKIADLSKGGFIDSVRRSFGKGPG